MIEKNNNYYFQISIPTSLQNCLMLYCWYKYQFTKLSNVVLLVQIFLVFNTIYLMLFQLARFFIHVYSTPSFYYFHKMSLKTFFNETLITSGLVIYRFETTEITKK